MIKTTLLDIGYIVVVHSLAQIIISACIVIHIRIKIHNNRFLMIIFKQWMKRKLYDKTRFCYLAEMCEHLPSACKYINTKCETKFRSGFVTALQTKSVIERVISRLIEEKSE